MKKILIIVASLISFCNVSAQYEDSFGTRGSIDITKAWEKFSVGTHLEYRANNNLKNTDAWFLAANVGYNITKWLKGNLQYEYWGYRTTIHKIVPIVTATLRKEKLSVSIREKYEFAITSKTNYISNVLRSRLRAQYSIGEKGLFAPHISYEFFQSLDGLGWLRSYHIVGTEIRINKHHLFDIYYLYHLCNYPKQMGEHVIGIGYSFTF